MLRKPIRSGVQTLHTFYKSNTYAIIGKNGAGKSILLNLLLGILHLKSKNSIMYNKVDIDIVDMYWTRKNNIGVVQQVNIPKNETLGGFLLGFLNESIELNKAIENIIEKYNLQYIYSEFDIVDRVDDNCKTLSGGEMQKLQLMKTLLKNPDVLIFDEPTASMDYRSVNNLLQSIHLMKKDKIIIIVTHDNKIIKACDYVLTLKD